MWIYYQNNENQITLNHTTLYNLHLQIFESFVPILLNVNVELLICMVLQFLWKNYFLLGDTYLQKTLQVLTYIALLLLVSYFFFLHRSPSLSLCTVFHSVLSNIDEVLLIKPFANVFFFGDFNAHHDDCPAYSGGTERSGGISNDFTQMVNFPTLIPELTLTVELFWIYLFVLMLVFVLRLLSFHR